MNLLNDYFIKSIPNVYGTENMALFFYSFIMFTRPKNIIEVGCGYTTVFIAEAIKDVKNNASNLDYPGSVFREYLTSDREDFMEGYSPKFTIVEPELENPEEASRFEYLDFYENINKISNDIDSYLKTDTNKNYDMVCLDFGTGSEYLEYFKIFWEKLEEGGSIFFHNTLNNYYSRLFLAELKLLQKYEKDMEVVSFWEPHKKFQNSFTIVKKNKNYPIYYNRA